MISLQKTPLVVVVALMTAAFFGVTAFDKKELLKNAEEILLEPSPSITRSCLDIEEDNVGLKLLRSLTGIAKRKCYDIIGPEYTGKDAVSYDEAERLCKFHTLLWNSHLAVIRNQQEQDVVNEGMQKANLTYAENRTMFGLRQKLEQWHWMDGKELRYFFKQGCLFQLQQFENITWTNNSHIGWVNCTQKCIAIGYQYALFSERSSECNCSMEIAFDEIAPCSFNRHKRTWQVFNVASYNRSVEFLEPWADFDEELDQQKNNISSGKCLALRVDNRTFELSFVERDCFSNKLSGLCRLDDDAEIVASDFRCFSTNRTNNRTCVMVNAEKLPFHATNTACKARESALMTISSNEELNFTRRAVAAEFSDWINNSNATNSSSDSHFFSYFWLGATNFRYLWPDNGFLDLSDFAKWNSTEEQEGESLGSLGQKMDCAAIMATDTTAGDYVWTRHPCISRAFICSHVEWEIPSFNFTNDENSTNQTTTVPPTTLGFNHTNLTTTARNYNRSTTTFPCRLFSTTKSTRRQPRAAKRSDDNLDDCFSSTTAIMSTTTAKSTSVSGKEQTTPSLTTAGKTTIPRDTTSSTVQMPTSKEMSSLMHTTSGVYQTETPSQSSESKNPPCQPKPLDCSIGNNLESFGAIFGATFGTTLVIVVPIAVLLANRVAKSNKVGPTEEGSSNNGGGKGNPSKDDKGAQNGDKVTTAKPNMPLCLCKTPEQLVLIIQPIVIEICRKFIPAEAEKLQQTTFVTIIKNILDAAPFREMLRGPPGDDGKKGEKGEKGDMGEKGEKGDKGDQGDKGEKGDNGSSGLTGHEGLQGPAGPQGPHRGIVFTSQGADGPQAVNGDKDEKGDRGERGAEGPRGPPGVDGKRGEKGEQGDKGDTGDKGDKGDQGDKGEKGDNGSSGLTGHEGLQGPAGPQGPHSGIVFTSQGADGHQAANGDKDEKGDRGERGAEGPRGPPGVDGKRGEKGEKGERGDKGVKGEKGDRGEKGEKGETGSPGLTGPQGVKGDPGSNFSKTAEEIFPTIQPFVIEIIREMLHGSHGPQGPQGPGQGKEGRRGHQNSPGPESHRQRPPVHEVIEGIQGPRGPPGLPGPAGPRGPQGEPGAVGPQGPPGEKGVKGDKGDEGDRGERGVEGPRGPSGVEGKMGDKGDKGDKGEKGDSGCCRCTCCNEELNCAQFYHVEGARYCSGLFRTIDSPLGDSPSSSRRRIHPISAIRGRHNTTLELTESKIKKSGTPEGKVRQLSAKRAKKGKILKRRKRERKVTPDVVVLDASDASDASDAH